ncbi:MAG TPA: hypothetical protein DG761_10725 [Gammaproteobacteria bacterium]|jgi:hypothetical protein|nr:hypothetical protein [Acidiferrobacteraceae bacterium]MDP6398782.1 nitrate reductase associated protein [Arenicellales bacterium]MDP6551172.1 nitrate reductase associated protein [Arenicellales bacterium]MDP6918972.1 nitrate reductase associated protein [Arenicellales bacterium]HCX88485.1 hypothetical protein [Gammaproteobacteria bacterium]|tara:strand:- start:5495 stop:5953 length:459 start_codon:yes stop_codon:yes gene_type:complete
MEQVLAFERTKDPAGQFIPLVVRMKLDLAGARIHLADWQALADDDHRFLIDTPITDPDQGEHYFLAVRELLVSANRGVIERSAPATAETAQWLGETEPAAIAGFRADAGVFAKWSQLSRFERYLLCHAARKSDRELLQIISSETWALKIRKG